MHPMFSLKLLLLLALSLLVTTDCTQSVSGGTGTETVNTFASLPDGSPAVGATVQIVDAAHWIDSIERFTSPVIGKGTTDKNGYFAIEIPRRKGTVTLQIDHEETGSAITIKPTQSSDLDSIKLEKYASLSGSFTDTTTTPKYALLSGTAYRTEVTDSNSFSFDKVAPGTYALLSQGASKTDDIQLDTSLTLESGKQYTLDRFDTVSNRIVIDNFENGIGPTSLGTVFPKLGWYVLSDSLYYYWDTKTSLWKKGISAVIGNSPISYDSLMDSTGNHYFTFSTTLDKYSYYANAVIGISMSSLSPGGIDLSAMTGFSFKASGNGNVRLRFETANLDSLKSGLSHYTYVTPLTKTMQTYSASVDSLKIITKISDEANYPWKKEARNVLRIEFSFTPDENDRGEKLTLNLDDLILEGVSLTSLAEQSANKKKAVP